MKPNHSSLMGSVPLAGHARRLRSESTPLADVSAFTSGDLIIDGIICRWAAMRRSEQHSVIIKTEPSRHVRIPTYTSACQKMRVTYAMWLHLHCQSAMSKIQQLNSRNKQTEQSLLISSAAASVSRQTAVANLGMYVFKMSSKFDLSNSGGHDAESGQHNHPINFRSKTFRYANETGHSS
jgi:hypothetical protein